MKTPGINYGGSTTNIDPESGIRYGVIAQNSLEPEAASDIWYGPDSEDPDYESAWEGYRKTLGIDPDNYRAQDMFNLGYEQRSFVYDDGKYRLRDCLDSDVFILRSPYFTYAPFCSPCVPGAGDLNNALTADESSQTEAGRDDWIFPRVYCLGHDWFEDSQAPYVVFSVATGELVKPEGK